MTEPKTPEAPRDLRAAVEGLPSHAPDGYEWEWSCDHIDEAQRAYRQDDHDASVARIRAEEDHPQHQDELVSRAAVLALIPPDSTTETLAEALAIGRTAKMSGDASYDQGWLAALNYVERAVRAQAKP